MPLLTRPNERRKSLQAAHVNAALYLADSLAPEQDASELLWRPNAGPQTAALHCAANELYYGGQPGGGKSDLLLGAALTMHQRSLILRRQDSELEALIQRSRAIIGRYGRFVGGNSNTWYNLPGGRTIEFGGCNREPEKQKYQGRPHDLKAFDEIPNFLESQYVFINTWNRTDIPSQLCRVLAAGNPPLTAEGLWVIKRWGAWLDDKHPNPALPGELRYYAQVDGEEVELESPNPLQINGEEILPLSRTFIAASLSDNPILVATGYKNRLANLPEPLRSMLFGANFKAAIDDHPWQVIPSAWIRLAQARWQEGRQGRRLSAIGVDVARGGKDRTVLAPRFENWFAPLISAKGQDTDTGRKTAALIQKTLYECRGEWLGKPCVNIDVIGVGASGYDALKEEEASRDSPLHEKIIVMAVNAANKTKERARTHPFRFVNVRALMYWRLREALDPQSGEDIALPPDSELYSELCAPRWELRSNGIQIEPKEDIIKRTGHSPDKADSVVMAYYTAAMPASSAPVKTAAPPLNPSPLPPFPPPPLP